jgi:hypothetical protein
MRSWSKFFLLLLILLPLLESPPPTAAQSKAESVSVPNLRLLLRKAGYIFVGTVTAVERAAPTLPNAMGTVGIRFQVEQAIRGVQPGQTLVIHEWAGLWESGERYRPGQRLLLFLYSPSKLGLTSPVGGPLGRFPVDRDGAIAVQPEQRQGEASRSSARRRGSSRVSGRELADLIRRATEE